MEQILWTCYEYTGRNVLILKNYFDHSLGCLFTYVEYNYHTTIKKEILDVSEIYEISY